MCGKFKRMMGDKWMLKISTRLLCDHAIINHWFTEGGRLLTMHTVESGLLDFFLTIFISLCFLQYCTIVIYDWNGVENCDSDMWNGVRSSSVLTPDFVWTCMMVIFCETPFAIFPLGPSQYSFPTGYCLTSYFKGYLEYSDINLLPWPVKSSELFWIEHCVYSQTLEVVFL